MMYNIDMMEQYKNKDRLHEMYWDEKLGSVKIAKIHGVDKKTILYWMKKRDIPRRKQGDAAKNDTKYLVDETMFGNCDTPEKAYWPGFIMADGTISISSGGYKLEIELSVKDKEHLQAFKTFLNSNVRTRERQKTTPFGMGQFAIIGIYRKKIVQDLQKYGITNHKSGREQIKNIPKQYYSDFIRGVFDGDGWLTINHRKRGNSQLVFGICSGRKSFLEEIQNILISELNLPKTKLVTNQTGVYSLRYAGNLQVPKIMNYLLQNSDVRLERKYKLLEN